MKSLEAFLEAVRMYLLIGLVVAAVNALAFAPRSGESPMVRTVAILGDVVGWPRFLVMGVRAIGDSFDAAESA